MHRQSMFQKAIIETVHKKMENKASRDAILTTLHYLQTDEYPQSYVDVIFQNYFGIDIYDAFCFMQIHYLIQSGSLAMFQIPMGRLPFGDKFISETNKALSSMPFPFDGKFIGGTHEIDGQISWDDPVHAVVIRDGELMYTIAKEAPMGTPMTADFEMGYNSAAKIFFSLWPQHTIPELGIKNDILSSTNILSRITCPYARWPYGSEYITVLVPFHRTTSGLNEDDFNKYIEICADTRETMYHPYATEWKKE